MKPTGEYSFRFMQKGEVDKVYDLILNVFHQYVAPTYSKKGIETFLSALSIDYLKDEDHQKFTLVAEHERRIVGMLSNINKGHISLLFVDSKFQQCGIGTELVERYIDHCLQRFATLGAVTVSSSTNSLSFYERLGFFKLTEEQSENGLKFIPMQKTIRER